MERKTNENTTVYLASTEEVTTLCQGGVDLSGLVVGGFSGGQKEPVKLILDKTEGQDPSQEFERSAKSLGIEIN